MTADQWRTVWQVYERSSTVSEQDFEEFVESECRDPVVIAKVREVQATLKLASTPVTTGSPPKPSRTGQPLQQYSIQGLLGSGGTGEVYAARDTRLNRQVAIKFLFQENLKSEPVLQRFLEEAKATSALNHPNIVTIHDFIREEGEGAIVMEYVDGTTLRKAFPGPISEAEAVRIGAQIARALDAAHARGIVHRDIKPENVMIRKDGYAKLVDFGLAILDASKTSDSPEADPAGTLRYMSPEQLRGDPLGASSDIYSLGVVLLELLFGAESRLLDTEAVLRTMVERKLPAIHLEEIPTRDRTLAALLKAMLNFASDARPSAGEVARRLESVSSRTPVRPWPFVLAVVVTAATFFLLRPFSPSRPGLPPPQVLTSLAGEELGAAVSPDGAQVAYAHDAGHEGDFRIFAQRLRSAETPARLTEGPNREIAPAWSPNGRMIAFIRERPDKRAEIVMHDLATKLERAILAFSSFPPIDEFTLEWTGDSQWIICPAAWPLASAGQSPSEGTMSALYAFSVGTGESRQLTAPSQALQAHPSLSADGRTLAYFLHATSVERITLQSLGAGLRPEGATRILKIPEFDNFSCRSPLWLHASGRLAFLSNRNGPWQLWTVQIHNGRASSPRLLQSFGDGIIFPSLTRDGRTLVFSARVENANTWRMDRNSNGRAFQQPRKLGGSTRLDRHPRISPDARRIAFQSDRTGFWEIWISDMEGRNAFQLTDVAGPFTGSPNWSPDSSKVVFESRSEGRSAIFTVEASPGARPSRLTTGSANEFMPAFSPDGNWIYFNSDRSGSFAIWRIPARGGPPELFLDHPDFAPAVSPDGQYLYVIGGPNSNKTLRRITLINSEIQDLVANVMDRSAAVTSEGVYALYRSGPEQFRLLFVPAPTSASHSPEVRAVAALTGKIREGLSLTRDGRSVIFTRQEQRQSNLMLVRDLQ